MPDNSRPIISGIVADQNITDENIQFLPFAGATFSDPGSIGQDESVTLTVSNGNANGVLEFSQIFNGELFDLDEISPGTYLLTPEATQDSVTSALGQLYFVPTLGEVPLGQTVTTDIAISITDQDTGETTTDYSTSINATAVNPPDISGTVADQTGTDNESLLPLSGVIISDTAPDAEDSVTLILSDSGADGTLSGAGLFNLGDGTYYLAADTPNNVTAELDGVTFTPTPVEVPPGQTVTTDITIDAQDGARIRTDDTTSIIITAANPADVPTISGTVANQNYTPNEAPLPLFSGVTFADPGGLEGGEEVTITLSNGDANGQLSLLTSLPNGDPAFLNETSPGVYQLIPDETSDDVTQALDLITFEPTPGQVPPGQTVTTDVTISVTDINTGETVTDDTTSLVVTAVTPPTIGGTVADQTGTDDEPLLPFAGVTISDAAPDYGESAILTLSGGEANGTLSGPDLYYDAPGNFYSLLGYSAAELTTALDHVVFTPTPGEVPIGQSVTTDIGITVYEGTETATDNTTSVVITAVSPAPASPPTITGTVADQTDTDYATLQPFSGVTVSDPAPGALDTVTLTLSGGDANGALSGPDLIYVGSGTYDLEPDTPENVTTALDQLTFTPTASEVTTDITITVTDGSETATDDTTSIINSGFGAGPPTITGTVADQTGTNDETLQPLSGVTISDPAADQLDYVEIDLYGDAVNGVGFPTDANGTLSGPGLTESSPGDYDLGPDTAENLTAELDQIVFTPTPGEVPPGQTVTTDIGISVYNAVDQQGADDDNTSVIIANATAPTITGTVADQNYTDETISIFPFSGVTFSDPASLGADEYVTITVSNGDANGELYSNAAGAFLSETSPGVYQLSPLATPEEVTLALQQMNFSQTEREVPPGQTVTTDFTISVTDQVTGATTTDGTTSIIVTAVNPPTISGTVADQTGTDSETLQPLSGVIVSDTAPGAEDYSFLTLSGGDANGTLSGPGLTYLGPDGQPGSYRLGPDTPGDLTAALDQVVFTPTLGEVPPGQNVTTDIHVEVSDGNGSALDANTSVIITSGNPTAQSPPIISGTVADQTGTDNRDLHPFSGVTISDTAPNAEDSVTLSVSDSSNNGFLFGPGLTNVDTGTYVLDTGTPETVTSELDQVTFEPYAGLVPPGQTVTTDITISVSDGSAVARDDTTSVIITAVARPTISGTVADQTGTDNANLQPFSRVTISDTAPDAVFDGVTLTLSGGDANGTLSGGGVFYVGNLYGPGTYFLPLDTPENLTAALDQVVFTPTPGEVPPGHSITTDVGITVSDGNDSTTDDTTSVVITAVAAAASPPTITGAVADQTGTDNASLQPFIGVTISDTTPGAEDTVTLTLSGGDANGTLSGPGLTYVSPGTYALATDTPESVTTALDQLTFTPTAGEVAPGQSVTTDMTITVTDGTGTAIDDTTSITIAAVSPQDTESGTAGATGGAGYSGQPGQSATATAYNTGTNGDTSNAEATGGTGGSGGNGKPAGGNGGFGGTGGAAAATATTDYSGPDTASATATANGGTGGAPGSNGSGGKPGNGGTGGTATASANATNDPSGDASAEADATGGTGGAASGAGTTGGNGGSVSGTTATASGLGGASATVIQQGGAGGAGTNGANGGAGAASTLTNAVSGSSQGASLALEQEARGGAGGSSDTGRGGSGGFAISDLSINDSTSPDPSTTIYASDVGFGGNGGSGAVAGNGGATWDAATVVGGGSVSLFTGAYGGAGGPTGGDAEASANATGNAVNVSAAAEGGIGQNVAGIATATATGTGASGNVDAAASTDMYAGNLVTHLDANASAVVDGTNNALTQTGIDTTLASVSHAGALAYIDAQPVASFVARAEAGAPNTTAAVGATPTILAMGALGGGHASQGTDTETSSASLDITVDLLQLATTPDLYLGFYRPSVIGAAGISDINLTVAADGTTLISQDFTTAAAAQSWFNDNPIDLGSLGSGPLAGSAGLSLSIALGVTTTQAGSGLTTDFLLAYNAHLPPA